MKNILNRGLSFAMAASVLGFGLMAADNASAQTKWPDKTVRMIVPAPPGSAPDGHGGRAPVRRRGWSEERPRATRAAKRRELRFRLGPP